MAGKSEIVTLTTASPSRDTNDINGFITAVVVTSTGITGGTITISIASPTGDTVTTVSSSISASANATTFPQTSATQYFVVPGRKVNIKLVSGTGAGSVKVELQYVSFI